MVASNKKSKAAAAAHYREYRVPAKDLDGQEMCAASPVAYSPGRMPAHKQGVRQAPKQQSQPLRELPQDDNLKAHAIRKSDLMALSCESIGSFSTPSHPDNYLDSGHHSENIPAKGRTKGKRYGGSVPTADSIVERQPLHALNGAVSRTEEVSNGTVEEVAKDAETFRSRRLRQMQAANEELLKRRSHHSTTAQDSTTRGTQQPAKEVKTTFFQVSGLTGAQGAQPSTEALLRAVKAKQQLQHKQRLAQEPAPARSASMPKKGSGAEAKKLVYTLHSPSMDQDAPASVTNTVQPQSRTRPQSQPPPAPEKDVTADNSSSEQARGRHMQRDDVAGGAIVPSQTAEHVRRKVAALARGFEARAGTSSPSKLPDSGASTPRRAAAAAATSQQTPSPVVNYQSYGMGANSSRKLWPPFHIAPEWKVSPCPGSSEPKQVEPEVDTAGADPPRVIRALSFRGAALETTPQPPADVQPPVVVVPARPQSTTPQQASEQPVPDAIRAKRAAPISQAAADVALARPAAAVHPTATGKIPSMPPAVNAQVVKPAGLARAQVKAFGSPFKQKEAAAEEAHANVSMSLSCNVNMASPTGDSGAEATSFEWQSKPPQEQTPSSTQAALDPRKAAALDRKKKLIEANEAVAEPSAAQHAHQDTDLRVATPPAAQTGGSLLMQRVSDAATSPVDSFWRPLKKALAPQPAAPHDHIEQQTLLAPDGSPADPAFGEVEMAELRNDEVAPPFSLSRHNSDSTGESSRRRTGSSARDPELRGQHSGESSRLQPAVSRGALEASAAHMRDNSAFEEPFVDLLGVQVSSAYLKAGGSAGETAEVSQGGQAQSGGPSNKNVRDMHGDGKMPELQ